ncbi:unnamed protein product [Lathyrus oleraceus]
MKRQTTLTQLPPRRGLVKIRVLKSLVKSVTAFASGDSGRNNCNGNGVDDGGDSPSITPPIPNGYNSDQNN